jgi:tetratricopeptide (TPR) repeat protein
MSQGTVVCAEDAAADIILPTTLPAELPETVDGKLDQAEAHLNAGELVEALQVGVAAVRQALRDAMGSTPSDPGALATYDTATRFMLRLGDRAVEVGDLAVAQSCYYQVHRRRNDMWQPLLGLADVARLSGRTWEAFEYYSEYLEMKGRPRDHRGDLGIGLTYLDLGKPRLAYVHLDRAVQLAPNNAEAKMGFARALYKTGKHKEALKHAEKAVELDNREPPEKRHRDYRYFLAIACRDAGEPERADREARQLANAIRAEMKQDPTNDRLLDQLDRVVVMRFGLLDSESKTDAKRRDPQIRIEMARLVEDRGLILQIKTYLEALAFVLKAWELDPKNVAVLRELGRLYRLVGDRDHAIEAYQTLLQVSPGHDEAKKALRDMDAPLAPPKPTTTTASTGQ